MDLRPSEPRVVRGSRRWAAAAVATVLLSVCIPAAPVERAGGAQRFGGQLPRNRVRELAAGKFLVASRNLPDPNFGDSVVLLAEYGEEGAMGLIINVPTEAPVSRVLDGLKGALGRSDTVFFGGPVSQTGAVALLRSRAAVADSRRVLDEIHLITSKEALETVLASGAGADELRVYLGYSGWGAGQLDRETALGSWHVLSGDADVVFDPEPESVWRRQIQRTERLIMVERPVPPGRTGPSAAVSGAPSASG